MRILLLTLMFFSLTQFSYAQKERNIWPFGVQNLNGHPMNISFTLDFNSLPAKVKIIPEYANIFWYYAQYCDPLSGELLFFSNGLRILNAEGEILPGCDSINYGEYWIQFNNLNSDHPTLTQGSFISISPDTVWLIHQQLEKPVNAESPGIDFTQFTLLVEKEHGYECVLKDEKIKIGAMIPHNVVRHGNGVDWWIVIPDKGTNIISKYLLSENGITWHDDQAIGYEILSPIDDSGGLSCFSVNGDKYAYYNNLKANQIFDFDRCTGLFSNPLTIPLETSYFPGFSLSFSPNGRFLYVPTWYSLIQYDLEAEDIPASADTVAVYDSYVCLPDWPPGAGFNISILGPDGKIYISAANSNNCIHVINRPNLRGKACDVRQHGVMTPGITNSGMPGYINYQLGPLIGSPCDPDGG